MKKIIALIIPILTIIIWIVSVPSYAFTEDISKESFMVSVDNFFPSFGTTDKIKNSSGKWIDNIPELIKSLIPMVTTFMAVGATLMVIWGGYQMVFGWANPNQTEAGKGIIKDAMIGLMLGLLAYVIVLWTWGKKLAGIEEGATGLPWEDAENIIQIFKTVITKLQDITAIIAVLGICIVGLMYIMSHGSEEKTEAAKKYMVTILIGVLLAFTAWGIMSLINLIPNSFTL